jgi:dolichol kinase
MVSLQIVKEYKRKFFHMFCLIYVALYILLPRVSCLQTMGALGLLIVLLEWARLGNANFNAWVWDRFGGLAREWEKNGVSGLFWTWLGSFLTMVIFPQRDVVLAALGFMIFGDAAAALVGKLWGRHPWPGRPGKTMEGSAAFAIAAAAAGLIFLPPLPVIISALVVAGIESLRLPVDDNLWIPIVSAACLRIIRLF